MKNLQLFLLSLFVAFAFTACGGGDGGSDNGGGDDSGIVDDSGDDDDDSPIGDINAKDAVSVWNRHSLRTEAGGGGKWKATLSFGEEMEIAGDTIYDAKKKKYYSKVKLLDGSEGYVRYDLIHYGGELAAVMSEADIYSRPSVANIGNDKFEAGDLVVVMDKKEDNWTRVIGKNDSKGKRKRGWVLGKDVLTKDEIDIAVAVLMSKAMDENLAKRKEMLEKISENPTYASSMFMKQVDKLLEMADPSANLGPNEVMVTGNVVNVRSSTSIEEDNKLFQVKGGDVGTIVEKGMMDEIKGNTDYWYKVSFSEGEGWIFGSNTTRSISK